MFQTYLARWHLVPDGAAITSHAGYLLPVRHRGKPAMLKLAKGDDERAGAAVLAWWDGDGAATVLARDHDAVLMERAEGMASLSDMARGGQDDEASRILCNVAAGLHRGRNKPLPDLVPLQHWFRELAPAAATHGGLLRRCSETADALLAEPRDVTVLHGDLHHDNVLDFGPRGWLAIDPKNIIGESGFDFANIFTNPDLSDPTRPVGTLPGRFQCRVEIVRDAAGLDHRRLLQWTLAWTGLSAAWFLGDGDPAAIDFQIAEMAAAELDR
jgi:streptomycin 6-kinase